MYAYIGVETPGPDYTPDSPYWGRGPKHHIGVCLQQKSAETPGPGNCHKFLVLMTDY